ncbi:DUF1819 family protein [Clostridium sp. 2218st1_F5_2218SCRN_220325]|uniref:DUF1819 family protein n=1 Tax=Clostridium sp. 2218st1_F5_2218SCRN_220325 TaxID=3143056 RepID=UPI00319DAC87
MNKYKASITREQFLFFEMRTTAKLLTTGMDDYEIVETIIKNNLFQYPTEKSIKRMALACINRLRAMEEYSLIEAIASQPVDVSKQICLYAMMKQSKLIWDFMVTVIGEKYRLKESTFSRLDLNIFFMRLQEQDNTVSTWSETTINKIKQVIKKVLVENEYLDNTKSEYLNPVLLNPLLENVIISKGENILLPAFNCFP